ncbi:MAG: hypothetical protein IAX21_04960 [Candidatus Bathyarchaeota archaeon]|nr:V-type ATP synthase subunit F [Candidatus Bathyarchaeum tardum]WGM89701.1 MAG: V-type ATP synthase subunit F [Candidatus Bathyarchaeum tardum]WNZ30201.1 MAG: hypothetical protein IAX21_04960 [Candidatus Bathyarchaeota archaeon]
MKEIGLLADRHTATCFKLAGLRNVFSVNDHATAEETFFEILEKNNLRVLLVSEIILNNLQNITTLSEQQSPLIVPIPTMLGRGSSKVDFMVELIKNKTGIEVKL